MEEIYTYYDSLVSSDSYLVLDGLYYRPNIAKVARTKTEKQGTPFKETIYVLALYKGHISME